MYVNCLRISTVLLIGALAACVQAGTKTRSWDAAGDMASSEGGGAADDATSAAAPDAEEGAEDASFEAQDGSDGAASTPEEDAGMDDPLAADEDAGTDAREEHDAGNAGIDISGGPTGRGCHQLDALGPLVSASVVTNRWPAPGGGIIVPGTYYLTAEEHFVAPHASADEAADCVAFWGAYRESLLISEADLARVYQDPDGIFGRFVERYRTDGTALLRNRMCPTDSPHPEVSSFAYTAAAGELLLFDFGTDACAYMFRYEKQR